MTTNSHTKTVPGTQLCNRALYTTIVGQQPHDCPPGTSVKMTNNGPIVLDHVMRVAKRYIGDSLQTGIQERHAHAVSVDKQTAAMNKELISALEELGSQNRRYERDLNTFKHQLEMRKQEVQALQNKLRLLHMESKNRHTAKNIDHKKKTGSFATHSIHNDTVPPFSQQHVDKVVPHNSAVMFPPPPMPPPTPPEASSSEQTYANDVTAVVHHTAENGNISLTVPAPQRHADMINCSADDTFLNNSHGVDFPLLVVEDVTANGDDNVMNNKTVTANSYSLSSSRKNGILTPSFPQHLVSSNPGAMFFCNSCRVYFPPHPVSLASHVQSERHQKSVTLPSASKETYAQFGKLLQRMPSFLLPSTAVSEEDKCFEKRAGNTFFNSGFDIVYSMCSLCKEIVTTQSYKVHESLATHRKRVEDAEEKAHGTVY